MGNALRNQDQAASANPGSADDEFGFAVAALDYDGDCVHDLAIGAPGEDVGGDTDAGGVQILFGGAFGLTMLGNLFYDQGPLTGAPQPGDRLGAALPGSPDQVPL